MIPPRWTKVFRDLSLHRIRTLLAILALSIGTFAVGADLSAYAVLSREIEANFRGTSPPSIIVHLERPGADARLARAAEQLGGVASAEARGVIEGRALVGSDEWRRLLLFAVENFDALKVSTFRLESGRWPLGSDEMVIERSAVPFLQRSVGDVLEVQAPHGERRALCVVGIVHDPAQSPGWMDGIGYGYITQDTLANLGEGRSLEELRVILRDGASASATSNGLRQLVQDHGRSVSFVNTREAARHPHADQMDSLLLLFGVFGALSLTLGALLGASVIEALLRAQVRQIGAMKAIGASARQIATMYAGAVVLLAAIALSVGVPLGVVAGVAYARFVATVLNFDLTSLAVPGWVFLLQIGAGIAVPLVAAMVPVYRASTVTVRQAIGSYGIGDGNVRSGIWDHIVARIPFFDRPTLLSLRNTFRNRGRLCLTLALMTTGGATFMSALNVGESWQHTVDSIFEARRYDLQILFSQPYEASRIREVLSPVPGVRSVETWTTAWAFKPATPHGSPEYRMQVTGVPAATDMVRYPLLEGRWLQPDDSEAIVVNHELRQDRDAHLTLGDRVTLTMGQRTSTWHVVGVVRDLGVRRRGQNIPASAYVNQRALEQATGTHGMTANVVLSANTRDADSLRQLTQRLERALDATGLNRITVQPSTHRRQELLDHLAVIRNFLLAMAALVFTVGGLSLASAMSVEVMERTREIGVMRAIGAATRAIVTIFAAEGLIIAALAGLFALVVSVPMSSIVGNFAGRVFVHADLDNTISVPGVLSWFCLALVIGLSASVLPTLAASRGPVSRALRYE